LTKKQAKRTDKQANEFEASLTDLSENSKLVVAKRAPITSSSTGPSSSWTPSTQ